MAQGAVPAYFKLKLLWNMCVFLRLGRKEGKTSLFLKKRYLIHLVMLAHLSGEINGGSPLQQRVMDSGRNTPHAAWFNGIPVTALPWRSQARIQPACAIQPVTHWTTQAVHFSADYRYASPGCAASGACFREKPTQFGLERFGDGLFRCGFHFSTFS